MKGMKAKEFGPAPRVEEEINEWIEKMGDSLEILDWRYNTEMFPMQDNLGGAGLGSISRVILFYKT